MKYWSLSWRGGETSEIHLGSSCGSPGGFKGNRSLNTSRSSAGAKALKQIRAGSPGEWRPGPRSWILPLGLPHIGIYLRGFAKCPGLLLPHGVVPSKYSWFPGKGALCCSCFVTSISRLHWSPSCGLGLRVSDLLSPPLCPPTGPAHLTSSLDEGDTRSRFLKSNQSVRQEWNSEVNWQGERDRMTWLLVIFCSDHWFHIVTLVGV